MAAPARGLIIPPRTLTGLPVGAVSCGLSQLFQIDEKRNTPVYVVTQGFPGGSVVRNPPTNVGAAGDAGLIPGSGRSPGGGNGNPFQFSCLGSPTDRGAWWTAVHRVAQNWTQMKSLSMHACIGE